MNLGPAINQGSLNQHGAWTPVTATFTKLSANFIQNEVSITALTEARSVSGHFIACQALRFCQ